MSSQIGYQILMTREFKLIKATLFKVRLLNAELAAEKGRIDDENKRLKILDHENRKSIKFSLLKEAQLQTEVEKVLERLKLCREKNGTLYKTVTILNTRNLELQDKCVKAQTDLALFKKALRKR